MTEKKIVTTVFGIKNCDTMKKAMTWLTDHGVVYEFVDYKKAGVAAGRLPDWAAQVGWETLLNRKGLTWKKLPEERRTDVDEAAALVLMAEQPSMIKRPVVEVGGELLVGFDPEVYARTFALGN